MKNILTEKQKEKLLSLIPNVTYREVMKYWCEGLPNEKIGDKVGYSKRQVERIVGTCRDLVIVELLRERENNA